MGRCCLSILLLLLIIATTDASVDTLQAGDADSAAVAEFQFAVRLYNDALYDLSLEHFRRIMETAPATPQGIESRYYLGLIYRALGQSDNSRMTLQTFALTFPDHPKAPDAWWTVSEIFTESGRHADAGVTLERLLQFHPEHPIVPKALYEASNRFEQSGDSKRAEEFITRILLRHSDSDLTPQARLRYGEFRLRNDDYESARAVFRRVIADLPAAAVDPGSQEMRAQARFGIARSVQMLGYVEQADSEYVEITRSFRNSTVYPHAIFGRAEIAAARGSYHDAVELYREGQQLAAQLRNFDLTRRALFEIASSYRKLGDYSGALTFFDLYARTYSAESTPEELIAVWSGAAECAERVNDHRGALEWWKRLTDAGDDSLRKKALARAALSAEALGDFTEAVIHLRTLTDAYPDNDVSHEALFRLGRLYEENLGDHRRGLAAYEELAYRFPSSRFADDAFFGRIHLNLKLGNDAQAHHLAAEFPNRFPGSDLLPAATDLKEKIELHHMLDRDGGFQSITLLMSEMIGGAPRGELAYRLGEIYLDKLKQYPEAARQFAVALSLDLPPDKQGEAVYRYAYSLYRMAPLSEALRSEAMSQLRNLIEQNPRSPHAETISYYYLDVLRDVAGPAEFIAAAERYLQTYRRPEFGDRVAFYLAEKLDSIGDQKQAIERYRDLSGRYQNSSFAAHAKLRLARLHFDLGDTSAALGSLTEYARRHPDGTEITGVLFSLGETAIAQSSFSAASDYFGRIAGRFPYHSRIGEARVSLALSLYREGKDEEAFGLLAGLIEAADHDPFGSAIDPTRLLYPAAMSAYRLRKTDRAMELFSRFIAVGRDGLPAETGKAALMLGELYRKRGDHLVSERYYRIAGETLTEGQTTPEIADLLFANRRYPQAAQHYTRLASSTAAETEKRNYESRAIVSLYRAGRTDAARQRSQTYAAAYPGDRNAVIEFELEAAMHLFRSRSYDNAAAAFQRFLQQHGNSEIAPSAHFYLGRTWEAVGRLSNAQQKYEEILKQYPRAGILPQVRLAYGGLLLRQQKVVEAIDEFRFIIEHASHDDELMYYTLSNMITAYEEIGFFEPALELTEEFIRRYPRDDAVPGMRVKIGTLHQRARNFERSVEVFQALILTADRELEAELRYYTGDSYHMMGNYRRAISEFLTVSRLDPRTSQLDWTATAFYMAGQSYEQLGQSGEAIAMYQRIIDARGIDQTYKAAARREIERVRNVNKESTQ